VHAEDAAEPEDPEPRAAERQPERQHHVEPDVHAGGRAPGGGRDLRDLDGGGDAQVEGPQRQVELAADGRDGVARDLLGADLHVPGADQRARDVDAGGERRELGRPRLVEEHAQAGAVDRDDAEVDAEADVDLERQRVGARDARAEHAQDLPERLGDLERAAVGDVDGVAARAVEDRAQDELLGTVVGAVAEAQPDGLVTHDQRVLLLDLHEVGDVGRPVDLEVEEDVGLDLVAAVALHVLGAEDDHPFDTEPGQEGDRPRKPGGDAGERGVDHRPAAALLRLDQERPEAQVRAEQGERVVLRRRHRLAGHPPPVHEAVLVGRVGAHRDERRGVASRRVGLAEHADLRDAVGLVASADRRAVLERVRRGRLLAVELSGAGELLLGRRLHVDLALDLGGDELAAHHARLQPHVPEPLGRVGRGDRRVDERDLGRWRRRRRAAERGVGGLVGGAEPGRQLDARDPPRAVVAPAVARPLRAGHPRVDVRLRRRRILRRGVGVVEVLGAVGGPQALAHRDRAAPRQQVVVLAVGEVVVPLVAGLAADLDRREVGHQVEVLLVRRDRVLVDALARPTVAAERARRRQLPRLARGVGEGLRFVGRLRRQPGFVEEEVERQARRHRASGPARLHGARLAGGERHRHTHLRRRLGAAVDRPADGRVGRRGGQHDLGGALRRDDDARRRVGRAERGDERGGRRVARSRQRRRRRPPLGVHREGDVELVGPGGVPHVDDDVLRRVGAEVDGERGAGRRRRAVDRRLARIGRAASRDVDHHARLHREARLHRGGVDRLGAVDVAVGVEEAHADLERARALVDERRLEVAPHAVAGPEADE
jgi:hypothetical protein